MAYWWESELSAIIESLKNKAGISPEKIREHTREAVTKSIQLFKRIVGLDFTDEMIPEVIDFFKTSIVRINLLMPEEEPGRLAIRIPVNPPRIEIRRIEKKYTLDGSLTFMTDECPEKDAGERLAVIELVPFPESKIH